MPTTCTDPVIPCVYCGGAVPVEERATEPWPWPGRGLVTNCKGCAGILKYRSCAIEWDETVEGPNCPDCAPGEQGAWRAFDALAVHPDAKPHGLTHINQLGAEALYELAGDLIADLLHLADRVQGASGDFLAVTGTDRYEDEKD